MPPQRTQSQRQSSATKRLSSATLRTRTPQPMLTDANQHSSRPSKPAARRRPQIRAAIQQPCAEGRLWPKADRVQRPGRCRRPPASARRSPRRSRAAGARAARASSTSPSPTPPAQPTACHVLSQMMMVVLCSCLPAVVEVGVDHRRPSVRVILGGAHAYSHQPPPPAPSTPRSTANQPSANRASKRLGLRFTR